MTFLSGGTPGRWVIGGGNDEDDYPTLTVFGRARGRSFQVYSLHSGLTVAYFPFQNEAEMDRAQVDALNVCELFNALLAQGGEERG